MKKVTIKKEKVWVFTEDELRENLNLAKEEIDLILNYQRKFPELLQEGVEGFIISGDQLWEELGKPQGEYSKWFKRKIKPLFTENKDYVRLDKIVGTIKNNVEKKVERHNLTVETAKHICLSSGSDANSKSETKNIGNLVRNYFILAEKTLRNYKDWNIVRGQEKTNWNEMRNYIKDWCKNNKLDSSNNIFYIREANMINEALLNRKACEIRFDIKAKDIITRDHLNIQINQAINFLQSLNIGLLIANIPFEQRKSIIEQTCFTKYSKLKNEFESFVKKAS